MERRRARRNMDSRAIHRNHGQQVHLDRWGLRANAFVLFAVCSPQVSPSCRAVRGKLEDVD